MVKLYSYSSKLLNFVEAKWFTAKFGIAGIIIGIIILFGAIKLNQSVGKAFGFQSTSTLTAENNFLRHQVRSISARVSKMEMQATQLDNYTDNLDLFLHGGKIAGDTIPGFTNTIKSLELQPFVYAANSPRH